MSDNVIQLRPTGPPPVGYDGITCEQCGDAWFSASVTVGRDGRVTGWVTTMRCNECGHETLIAG